MPPLHSVEDHLAAAWPPHTWGELNVLLAVSGGADSVAMLRAMQRLKDSGKGRVAVAHFNHHLRGSESDEDQAFVQDLSARLGLECHLGDASEHVWTAQRRGSLEAVARTARYDFFRQAAEHVGARYLVTAHTADDQAETILHRIIRGTGIAGLAGINRVRTLGPAVTVMRPLLGIRRAELLHYLQTLGQSYRGDSSNDDPRYTRNRIRHHLLPALAAEYNTGVIDALLRLGLLASEVQTVVDTLVEDLAESCVTYGDSGMVTIDASQAAMQPRYVVRELLIHAWQLAGWPLQAMGFAQWEQLADMVYRIPPHPGTRPRRQVFPGNVHATLEESQLQLERKPVTSDE